MSILAVGVAGSSACGDDATPPEGRAITVEEPVPPTEPDILTVHNNAQADVGDLSIGAGNFWEREYAGADGNARSGATAMLFLSVRGHVEQHERVVAYPGLVIEKIGYRLRVEAVDGAVVTVRVLDRP